MKRFCAPSLLLLAVLVSLATKVSGMGFFTTLMAHIQEKADGEISRMRDSSSSSNANIYFSSSTSRNSQQRSTFMTFPGSSSNNNKNDKERINRRRELVAREQRNQHGYMPPMNVARSYSSRDEELLERLVELQH
mmetsp:Transcript_4999/g.11115  ORF Transcript_4999/g.11115 Transcript_4999/m.11115 type:complete len:135 (+) Transcript_4999:350-754(+)|eukprot:CAMPEP_0168269920 /NCGR_PEP_ID=MMETSP0141_2-20121125/14603_1 /TAXON_ID=44445 /ORGANISM="Pseudo-nitzschia australis, Strain 10249 10 AB" /LENGTH=134 /DNA_ID=CAMNT_0008210635 /DNA_START=346 /DNA_END=750 /DNA_ORIENTATION=+